MTLVSQEENIYLSYSLNSWLAQEKFSTQPSSETASKENSSSHPTTPNPTQPNPTSLKWRTSPNPQGIVYRAEEYTRKEAEPQPI